MRHLSAQSAVVRESFVLCKEIIPLKPQAHAIVRTDVFNMELKGLNSTASGQLLIAMSLQTIHLFCLSNLMIRCVHATKES